LDSKDSNILKDKNQVVNCSATKKKNII